MATAYPTGVTGDYDAGDSVPANAASTVRDIHECAIRKPTMLYFAELTETSVTYVEQKEWWHYVTDYYKGRTFQLAIEAKVDAGTGTWSVIDKDDGDALVSDEIAITGTSYAVSVATITVPGGVGWPANTRRNLAIQAKVTSGDTISIENEDNIASYCTD